MLQLYCRIRTVALDETDVEVTDARDAFRDAIGPVTLSAVQRQGNCNETERSSMKVLDSASCAPKKQTLATALWALSHAPMQRPLMKWQRCMTGVVLGCQDNEYA